MTLFDGLSLLGGLALFLFGMQVLGAALEKKAGSQLKTVLGRMTDKPIKGFLLGLGVTSIIQSSSATTVMVVGFVNSGVMTLHQAIHIIMGANVGTTVTAWILSLTGISSTNFWIQLLKPSSFTPVLALIGVGLCLLSKNAKKKDTGTILLGFAVLMYGMEVMSSSVAGLKNDAAFTHILLLFSNPILGVLAGTVLTAIIQSSSASVGILQALSSTGAVTYATAIPIIMGQNIGTCVTALIASVGTNKNARRAAFVHLYFNIIGTVVLLSVFYALNALLKFAFIGLQANALGIAVVHSTFNILCTALLFPFSRQLERLACLTVRDTKKPDEYQLLDERLLATPAVAVESSRTCTVSMAERSVSALRNALRMLTEYDSKTAEEIRRDEESVDQYEDMLGTYLVKLSARSMTDADSAEATKLLHIIGDFERISDHAVNLLKSAEEIREKKLSFSAPAKNELAVLSAAVNEILDLTLKSFVRDDLDSAVMVEPLEQTVDKLKEVLRSRHIVRMQKGQCTIEMGFVLSDILTDLERVSDHCSNIAGCMLEMSHEDMDIHSYLRTMKGGGKEEFNNYYDYFMVKYAVPAM